MREEVELQNPVVETEEIANVTTEQVEQPTKKRHHKNKQKHTAKEARELFMNRKKRITELDVSLPDLEDLDDELGVMELTAKDVETAQKLSKGPDGEIQEIELTAILVARAIVILDTRERVFTDQDAGFIVDNFSLTVLQPLGTKIQETNNLSGDALEQARKNLKAIQEKGSATT